MINCHFEVLERIVDRSSLSLYVRVDAGAIIATFAKCLQIAYGLFLLWLILQLFISRLRRSDRAAYWNKAVFKFLTCVSVGGFTALFAAYYCYDVSHFSRSDLLGSQVELLWSCLEVAFAWSFLGVVLLIREGVGVSSTRKP